MTEREIRALIALAAFLAGISLGQWDAKYGADVGYRLGTSARHLLTETSQ